MPAHPFHLNVDLIMLGKQYPGVHATLDMYAAEMGPNHREYFHDDQAVDMIFYQFNDHVAAWSAYYHLVLDRVSDEVGAESCIFRFLQLYELGVIPGLDMESPPPLLLDKY